MRLSGNQRTRVQILLIASLVRFAATEKRTFRANPSFLHQPYSDDDSDFSDGDEYDDYSPYDEEENMSEKYDEDCYSDSYDGSGGMSINKKMTARLDSIRGRIPDAGSTLQSATTSTLENAASRVRLMAREIRGAHSSEFEGAMIKGTRPDDSPAKEKHVSRLVDTVQVFPRASGPASVDYYFIMLHKLWSRMVEPDWRSKSKAVYIFHRMSTVLDPQLHHEFVTRYERMIAMMHKPSKTRYYQMAIVTSPKKGTAPNENHVFLKRYSTYAVYRFVEFSGRFDQLQVAQCGGSRNGGTQKGQLSHCRALVALLESAQKVLQYALLSLDASVAHGRHAPQPHEVPLQCATLVTEDCFVAKRHRDALWEIFGEKLRSMMLYQKQMVDENDVQLHPDEVKATLRLCTWTRQAIPRVERTMSAVSKMMQRTGRASVRLQPNGSGPTDNDLLEHEEWLKGQPTGA